MRSSTPATPPPWSVAMRCSSRRWRSAPHEQAEQDEAVIVRLSDVPAEPIDWLWPGRIPRGKPTLAIGDPDVGKSLMSLDVASRITRGDPWPVGGGDAPLGNVVLLTAEDGIADTVRPRIDALGGDPERVFVFQAIRRRGVERVFSFDRDIPVLERACLVHQPVLIVIDPLSAYFGAKGD